jgi:hypothetical protein
MKNEDGATFGPLVAECGKVGISRTVAFSLCHRGLLETFQIGKKRFVYLASLRSLPLRLRKSGQKEVAK